jgi:outer membrane protein
VEERIIMRVIHNNLVRVGFAFLVVVFAVSQSTAQETGLKLGFIDIDKVVDNSTMFKTAFAELKKIAESSEQGLSQKEEELKTKFEDFKVRREFMNEEKATQQATQLAKERDDFLRSTQLEKVNFNKAQKEKIDPLLEELRIVVEEIAKKEGYAFIFKRRNIAFGDPKYDITGKVIEFLNK